MVRWYFESSFKDKYRRIYDYRCELLKSNLGSIIKVKVEKSDVNFFKSSMSILRSPKKVLCHVYPY